MALPILDGNQTAATLSTIIAGGAHIPAHTVVSLGSQAISDITSGVSGSVVSISNFPSTQTVAGTVTVGNFPATQTIAGTVTANIVQNEIVNALDAFGGSYSNAFPVVIDQAGGSNIPISGTVTANVPYQDINAGIADWVVSTNDPIPVAPFGDTLPISGTVTVGNSVTIGSLPAISGTVTANNPNGALTTRFGSVTTANTAQITSAVTNTSRKYLLAQNISAGTVTIGIGFSPTTTQGIQLAAGGGLTFDAFCPTGAVYWLGAVTGAAFTILEG